MSQFPLFEKAKERARKENPPGFFATLFAIPSLLTLLVPGVGHLYVGRPKRALFWFVLVESLFFAGYGILGFRLWGGGFNLGSTFLGLPLNYIPEAGNFLTTFIMLKLFPAAHSAGWMDAVSLAKMPVPWEHVGFLLTALSGLVNGFAAAEAWWFGRPEAFDQGKPKIVAGEVNPVVPALMSWIVPGLGQWVQGEKLRGFLQFVGITALFFLGLLFSDFTATDRSQLYFWYSGMILNGGATVVSTLLFAERAFLDAGSTMWDLGVTVTCIAGLMNVVVILDAYTLADKRSKEVVG